MAQEWQLVEAAQHNQRKIYCAWCGRGLGIPHNTTLPLTLKCQTCLRVFTLQAETDLAGRAMKESSSFVGGSASAGCTSPASGGKSSSESSNRKLPKPEAPRGNS